MDPVSLLFAVYLDSITSNVHSQVTDVLGGDVKAVVISYEGMEVPFQYQMWRVKDKSVCLPYQSELILYSKCTVAAKTLFADLCSQLSKTPSKHWRHAKTKNLYCNAAVSYQSTVAEITHAEAQTDADEARAACNLAIVSALGSRDPAVMVERDRVCGG
ncbi:hypothetical protein N9J88_02465 [Porticoccaceae bacterium]|nr:hypothetical protein [Porticoccaceae bacterium]